MRYGLNRTALTGFEKEKYNKQIHDVKHFENCQLPSFNDMFPKKAATDYTAPAEFLKVWPLW